MSGPFVVAAAAAYPQRLAAVASIYGTRLVTKHPDSAHRHLDGIAGELYFACAEIDQWATPEQIGELEAALSKAGVDYRIEWYPGAQHGFAFPEREGVYDEFSAERHWERLLALFERRLKTGRIA
jgi:carboxymethylenebutenolidase